MCCIFTCCGWMIDLLQRVWVFLMSCCVCSAVCCVLITASMSGVALGYNYSLSEYIDTKETNVSVYIKRGVFDDEVVNEMMDFRRQGQPQQPLRRNADNVNSKTASDDVIEPEQMPVDSGRRLDSSIVESNGFEGSLMKLTVKPPYSSTKETARTDDSDAVSVSRYIYPFDPTGCTPPPPDSLKQLKAIQGLINARKAEAHRNPMDKDARKYNDVNPYLPGEPPVNSDVYRRMMSLQSEPAFQYQMPRYQHPNMIPDTRRSLNGLPTLNPARAAVPDSVQMEDWVAAKIHPEAFRNIYNKDNMLDPPTVPQPVTFRTGPIRPTTVKYETSKVSTLAPKPVIRTELTTGIKSIDDENIIEDKFSDRERFDERSGSEQDIGKKGLLQKLRGPKIIGQENNEYYDDELKGLPVRRKRSINSGKSKPPERIIKAIPQKVSQDHATKFKVGSISNEIAEYPSVLVSKLHFLDNPLPNETTPANEKEVKNGTETVGVTVHDTHSIIESSLDKALKLIQSMFS